MQSGSKSRGIKCCHDPAQFGFLQLFGRFAQRHPFAFAFFVFGPFLGYVVYRHRVDHDDHRRWIVAKRFDVGIGPKAVVNRLPFDPCFFPGFGCCRLRRCLFVHWPAFGQNPPFGAAAGYHADFKLVVFDPVAKRCELCAHICLPSFPQFQGKLTSFLFEGGLFAHAP